MQDFTKLLVWQKAHSLGREIVGEIHPSASRRVPGLRAQIIRAALSIAQNIAEGCGKRSAYELARFSDIAAGSAMELRCELIQARDLKLISTPRFEDFDDKIAEILKMLNSLSRQVRLRHGRSETLRT